jgi:DNA-binding PadR family transcriptional regulator
MGNENKTTYVLLGLLSHEPLTGYEIKKRMDTTLNLFWSASYGSIYPTLNALDQNGYVIKSESKENGRDKITYTITDSGKQNLRQWLEKPVDKDELRYETILKLFFGSEAGVEITIAHIEAFEKKMRQELSLLKGSVAQLKKSDSEEAHRYYMLTAMFGVKAFESYLEWCDEARSILNQPLAAGLHNYIGELNGR